MDSNLVIAGSLLGLVVVLHFYLLGNALGCSSCYGNVCRLACPSNAYFQQPEFKTLDTPKVWFFAGVPLGAFIFAQVDGSFAFTWELGQMETLIPQAPFTRDYWLFCGGLLLGYASRLAGGCTSGHGLVGLALINPPSILAMGAFMLGGYALVNGVML